MEENISQQLKKLRTAYLICIYALLLFLIIGLIVLKKVGAAGFAFIALAVVMGLLSARNYKKYTAFLKDVVVTGALRRCTFLQNVTYTPEDGAAEDDVAATEMLEPGDSFKSNDLITAECEGGAFRQCDVSIQESSGAGQNRSTYSKFVGRWLCFAPETPEACRMQIVGGKFRHGRMWKHLPFRGQQEEFTVYTDDREAADRILTDRAVAALRELQTHYKAPVMLALTGGQYFVAVETGVDAMEGAEAGKHDAETEQKAVVEDLRAAAALVTAFVRQ